MAHGQMFVGENGQFPAVRPIGFDEGIPRAVKVFNKDAVCVMNFDGPVKSALCCAVGGFAVCVKIQDGAVVKMRAI